MRQTLPRLRIPVVFVATVLLTARGVPAATPPPGEFPLAGVLPAPGPHPDVSGPRDLYGWTVGHWDLETTFAQPDRTRGSLKGELHASWVLEGRAIQDLWISPPIPERQRGKRFPGDGYGTTLRIYDPQIDAWRVHWFEPQNNREVHLVGRRVGHEIVHEGTDSKGRPMRWIISEMKAESFRWRSEVSEDHGKTWKQTVEIRARRRKSYGRAPRGAPTSTRRRVGAARLDVDRFCPELVVC